MVTTALVLSGGNALGAFHGGAWEVLEARGVEPGWVVGTSTGAIAAALIAGNPPGRRLERLRQFWARVGTLPTGFAALPGQAGRDAEAALSLGRTLALGRPGLFAPNLAAGLAMLPGSPAWPSLFDLAPLRRTLVELVDWDRLNDGPARVTLVATDLDTGAEQRFDSRDRRLGPEHVMASAAFLPAFEPVSLDGRTFGDGGFSANLPLAAVLDEAGADDLLCVALDLFCPAGHPRTPPAAQDRNLDLFFSGQALAALERFRGMDGLRRELAAARGGPAPGAVTVLHLVHRPDQEMGVKMFDFSARSLARRWAAGVEVTTRGLGALDGAPREGFAVLRVESRPV